MSILSPKRYFMEHAELLKRVGTRKLRTTAAVVAHATDGLLAKGGVVFVCLFV